jgi:SnoaL-like domain
MCAPRLDRLDVRGGPVSDSGKGPVETMHAHLAMYDWEAFRAVLSPDIERIGPLGERLVGRDAYVELMSSAGQEDSDRDRRRTSWDVHRIVYSEDRRSAFARVTAHVPHGEDQDLLIEQTLAYEIDENGLISRIEVFWRDPRS